MPATPRQSTAVAVALGAVALVAPLVAPNDYVVGVLARICLYATLALGLNIVVGFRRPARHRLRRFLRHRLLHLCAFCASPHFGLHLPFLLALPIVVLGTALFGILIGAPTLRLGGDYLAIVTLGFGEITYLLLLNLDRPVNITNGPSGIIDIDPPALFGHVMSGNTQYYYLFLVVLALALLAVASPAAFAHRLGLAGDPRGRARRARDGHQHDGREAAGVRDRRFVRRLRGCAARVMAALRVPGEFPVHRVDQRARDGDHRRHGQPGRRGARRRVIVALPEVFRELQAYRLLVFGLMLMVLMIFRPQGILVPRGSKRVAGSETNRTANAEAQRKTREIAERTNSILRTQPRRSQAFAAPAEASIHARSGWRACHSVACSYA